MRGVARASRVEKLGFVAYVLSPKVIRTICAQEARVGESFPFERISTYRVLC